MTEPQRMGESLRELQILPLLCQYFPTAYQTCVRFPGSLRPQQ